MSRIQQLDAQTANMIAAGEVVERPAGVVKELVENAIDAQSTRIEIQVTEGGLKKITVTDDGTGMDARDAVMAFQRHATSKIHGTQDLWSIHTLGFRGEALPSIASVAKVTLTTSDGQEGTRVKIEYGKTVSVGAYPGNQGTEIQVEGLFYRTPARLKHMKSGSYENSLIQDVVNRFAMSHPEIAFSFFSDGRESLRTTGQNNLLEVLFQIWGRSAAEAAIPVDWSDADYHITGYLIKPELTRASRSYMQVFLNGRMVHTYRLYKAIQDGYEDFIVRGRYPLAVLQVSMDSQLVDVNVHPSKWEVRLSKENQLIDLIRTRTRETLAGTVLAPKAEVQESVRYYEPIAFDTDALLPQEETKPAEQAALRTEEPRAVQEPVPVPADMPQEAEETPETEKRTFPEMQVIGQLHDKFILCAVPDGLAILDQHACQERVHYEQIRDSLNREPALTELLVPLQFQVSADLVKRVEEINEAIADLHVRFQAFGPTTLIVREVPLWMQEVEEEPFLQDVLDLFAADTAVHYARLEKKKIATMACHRSIRFNRKLTPGEMQEVVRQLKQCQNPWQCPHGRPTFLILNEKELTKEFYR